MTQDLAWAARENRLPLLPGVMTPSEVISATAAGFDALKLFPARQAGGVDILKALAGPFPQVRFCPTGGITADTAREYLALPNVACVGGSWLTPGRRHSAAGLGQHHYPCPPGGRLRRRLKPLFELSELSENDFVFGERRENGLGGGR